MSGQEAQSAEARAAAYLQRLERSAAAIQKLKARLDAATHKEREPIAVVGLGLRFPGGADDAESFWELLCSGQDALCDATEIRPELVAPGAVDDGLRIGALAEVDRFDADFFGIAPREARAMDPQQRLLLEVAWHALEDAGIPPGRLEGSAAGVFLGICGNDWAERSLLGGDLSRIDTYSATGNGFAVPAGRLAYTLGLRGPALALDTACSSSLVAVHLAADSLRRGECDLALAGGVNLLLSPAGFVAMSKLRALSPSGRCASFDAAADGYVRGEGCGLLVLRRLENAERDGDRVLARIVGSAVNQDGRSAGLTAPNGPAQQAVIAAALKQAQLEGRDIAFVETHGTGTPLGDPIEARALAQALGEGRTPERPLWLGALKTQIGHLEGAAGVAGLIKTVLALQHRALPPNLHLRELNPHLPWEEMPLALPSALTPLAGEGPLHAGVSSFGISGTNAHVVLAGPRAHDAERGEASRAPHLLVLSARNRESVDRLAASYAIALAEEGAQLGPIAGAAHSAREQLETRVALVADDAPTAAQRLTTGEAVLRGHRPRGAPAPRIAFLFTGQGAQYPKMGLGLLDGCEAFAETLRACDAQMEGALMAALRDRDPQRLAQTGLTQPATTALQLALVAQWRAWGVEPAVCLGHSVGEIAAAACCGVLDFDAALSLAARRGALMQALPAGGAMLSVAAEIGALAPHIDGAAGIEVAAYNGPQQTVLSGDADALSALANALEAAGIRYQPLEVSHAFHSARMDPMVAELRETVAALELRAPETPLISNLSGALADATIATPEYWGRHAREAVRFTQGLEALAQRGITHLLEIGPTGTLLGLAARHPATREMARVASLRRESSGAHSLLEAAGRLWVDGASLRLEAIEAIPTLRPRLPHYPFARTRYWIPRQPDAGTFPTRESGDPLLGQRLHSAGRERVHRVEWNRERIPWLSDHRARGQLLAPAAGWLGIAWRLAGEDEALAELTIFAPLALDTEASAVLQLVRGDDLRIYREDGEGFEALVEASFAPTAPVAAPALSDCRERIDAPVDLEAQFATLAARGLEYGPAFRRLRSLWRCGSEVLGALQPGPPDDPRVLDSAFQALAAADPGTAGLYLPTEITGAQCLSMDQEVHWVVGRLESRGATKTGALWLYGEAGALVAVIESLRLRPLGGSEDALMRHLYTVAWAPAPRGGADATPAEIWRGAQQGFDDADTAIDAWLEARAQRRSLPPMRRLCIALPDDPGPGAALFDALAEAASSEGLGPTYTLRGHAGTPPHPENEERRARLDGDVLTVARLRPIEGPPPPLEPPAGEHWRLDIERRGQLKSLALRHYDAAPLGPEEVELEVHAAGLNFRDVLNALGQYPQPLPLGCECAGVVRRVGAEVRALEPGQAVMALSAGCFGPLARAPQNQVVSVPRGMSAADAATLPVAFATAWYGLVQLGALEAGQRVLIHAAAGGVGLAAVQIAQLLGAEIYATASPGKWPALRALGVEHLASSREAGFAEAFGHPQLDLVLNSLTGPMIPESLRLLREGGRFLEMGKAEIWDAAQVTELAPGVRYQPFDLSELPGPALRGILGHVRAACEAGELRPLPRRRVPITQAPAAFRHMARGRHIGKVVLELQAPRRKNSAVLITGGLGALGLNVARWLIETRGERCLVLLSRGGPTGDRAEAVAALRALGAEIHTPTADVADREALARVIEEAPPLHAIVHAAGVLEDGLLRDQDDAAVRRVMRPKLAGALNLDALAAGQSLEDFVCFSSAAAALAPPGQSAYAAANAALDALCTQRRARGLPGFSVQWGAWAGAGMAETRLADLQRRGLRAIEVDAGLALLGRLWDSCPPPVVAVLPAERRRLLALPGPLLRELRPATDAGPRGSLAEEVAARIRRALGAAEDAPLDADARFDELGLDSLMGVELHGELQLLVGRDLPTDLLLREPTLRRLLSALSSEQQSGVESSEGDAAVERFWVPRQLDHPEAILICLPYAGGEATEYSRWREGLPRWCELRAAWLPGRGPRREESPVPVLDRLVQDLLNPLEAACAQAPVSLFGHSLGALLAFELAHALAARGAPPARLLLSAPLPLRLAGDPPLARTLHTLDDDAMVHELSRLGGIPPQLRSRPALLSRFIDALRADLAAHETHQHTPSVPALSIPMALFGGRSDPLCTPGTLESWRHRSQGPSEVHLFPGGHFFLRAQRERLVSAVAELLSR